jgi:arylsulfatase
MNPILKCLVLVILLAMSVVTAHAEPDKPNILVIMADDVGMWNLSAYHRGMMGGRTPNLDRIANEGALFTDYYAQQSCTAGRAAFITGQTPFRTGLLKVGLPAAKQGLQEQDPTIAQLLKLHGYVTGQFGKNHLGDRNEFLPTVHGFDEFFGILYHLNAMQEPYEDSYPKAPGFRARFGPRNMVESRATDTDDPTVNPRWGRVGKQTIADGGPLPPHPGWTPRPSSTWRISSRSWCAAPRTSWSARSRPASLSFCGTTPRACTSGPTSRRSGPARAATASTPTA